MEPSKRRTLSMLAICGLALVAAPAQAQPAYPSKPVRLIVPYSSGGPSDVLARAIGQRLGESLGQPVVIENRTGAGGNIGTEQVAKAAPDGHTLILGTVGTHAINSSLYSSLPFDVARDFAPVALVASATIVMVSTPAVPAATLKEFVSFAKSKPAQLSFASPGSGTPHHMAAELFKTMAGVEMTHIPYKGAAPAITDLLGGQVPVGFVSLPAALPHVKAGKLRAVGVTAAKRSAVAPEVPTIAEAGLPGYEVDNWYAVFAPVGTSKDIVNRLNAEIVKLMQAPEVRERLNSQGFEILQSTPEQLAEFQKTELAKWARVVKASGAKAD